MKLKTLLLSVGFITSYTYAQNTPNVTVVFVIDQFAHHYLEHAKPHFKYGLKKLFDNGIIYNNAHFPHAMPATAAGHAALNTGVQAKASGIIGNYWNDDNNEEFPCDKDSSENAAVFAPQGTYNYGRSGNNILVDGISDQIMLSRQPGTKNVASFSLKSRAAIMCAGKLGKAFWYDEEGQRFTTSKAFYNSLPSWLSAYNKNLASLPKEITWNPLSPLNSPQYASASHSYKYTRSGKPLIGTRVPVASEDFLKTPLLQKILLGCAQNYFDLHLTRGKDDKLVLWIALSALDKAGHIFGPWSAETLDILYHADKDLGDFMNHIEKKVPPKNIVYMLTGDHGCMPIPELLQEKGYRAMRANSKKMIEELNALFSKKLWVSDLVVRYKTPQFFFDRSKWNNLSRSKQKSVMKLAIPYLESQAGIKKVWETHKLFKKCFKKDSIEAAFKNQLYPGRSGHLTVQVHPYTYLSKHNSGTGHKTPYGYDTHVPLVIYQKGHLQRKVCNENVWVQQWANTLADILQVSRPSASKYTPLPLA